VLAGRVGKRWRWLPPLVRAGKISRRKAARILHVSRSTLDRLLAMDSEKVVS